MTSVARVRRGVSLAMASPRDAWLLSRMLAWRSVLPLLKRRVPLARLAKLIARKPGAGIWADPADRVPDYVARLYRPSVEGDQGVCLERSLLTYRFLSGAGADPHLVVGVLSGNGQVVGHAWVVVDGAPLFESKATLGGYASLLSFGRDGLLDTSTPEGGENLEPAAG
jgi:hypothetical protein